VEKCLADLQAQFMKQLNGLLKRKFLTEQEFARAHQKARVQKADLKTRKEELTGLLSQARASEALIERIPRFIKTFVEAF
jgi:hypothetical protein